MKTKTILISSVGSLVGQNMLDALANRRQHLRVLGANSQSDAANNFRCDAAYRMPPAIQEVAYRKALMQLMDAEGVDIVIPGRDADVITLATLRDEHPLWAGRLMVGALEGARVMDDKFLSFQFSQQRGLPFAPTVSTDDPEARPKTDRLLAQFGFPLIAKPRQGNGSRGIRILTNASHVARAVTQPCMAIQPMLDAQADLDLDLRDGVPFFWGVPESQLYASQSLIHSD